MDLTRRSALFALLAVILVFAAYYVIYGLSGTLTVNGSMDKSVYSPGDSFSFNLSSMSGITLTSATVQPTSSSSTNNCNSVSGQCPVPVGYSLPGICGQTTGYVGSAAHGSGLYWSSQYNTWEYDEWDTLTGYTGYVLWGHTENTSVPSESDVYPFTLATEGSVHLNFYMWRASSNVAAYPVIAVCVDDTSDVGTDYVSSGLEEDTSSHSLSINGTTYYCYLYRVTASSGTSNVTVSVYNSSHYSTHKYYVLTTNTCFTKRQWGVWSSYCNDSYGYSTSGFLNSISVQGTDVKYRVYSDAFSTGYSNTGIYYYSGSGSSGTQRVAAVGSISSSASEGQYDVGIVICPEQDCSLKADPGCTTDWYIYRSSRSYYADFVASYKVQKPATSVSFTTSVSKTNDQYSITSISVSGGSYFDKVTVSDSCTGQTKAINASSFSCSGDTCTYNTPITFDMPASGSVSQSSYSCTATAKLYVDNSVKDTKTASVTVYEPSVDSFTANDTTTDAASWSARLCGAFSSYKIYLDNSSTPIYSESVSPSSPGACVTKTGSVTNSSITPGTHTLTIKLYTADSGEYSQRSDAFTSTYTYTYDITSFTTSQPTYNVVGGQSTTVSGTVQGDTSDPDGAVVKVFAGSQELWSASVGKGIFDKDWSGTLSCGQYTLTAKIFPPNSSVSKDSKTTDVTVRCWSASIGPSGSVDVPSDANGPLPNASITVYYDVSVNPSTSYTTKVYWNSTDITSKFHPGSGHTAVASLTPSDVPMSCGSTVTLKLELYDSQGTLVTTKTSTITLNCVEQYVLFKLPTNGSSFDTFGSPQPSDNFRLPVAVDYAGGDTVKFYLDSNSPVTPVDANCSDLNVSADACYYIPGTQLSRGDHVLTAKLYNGSSYVTQSSVSFTIYSWSFATFVTYNGDAGLVSVKEYGSHASSCTINVPDINVSATMLYSQQDGDWEYSIDKEHYDGKEYNITCVSPTGAIAYTYSSRFSFTAQGGGGGGGTVSHTSPTPPSAPSVVPFFPASAASGQYHWTVVDRSAFQSLFDSASVSASLVCVKPKSHELVSAMYCPIKIASLPASEDSLQSVLSDARANGCSSRAVISVGDMYCVKNSGSGVYRFAVNGTAVRILVAGATSEYSVFIALSIGVAILLAVYLLYIKGVI